MSTSKFNSIQDKIFELKSDMGYGYQIRGDNHVGVVTVNYDENSGPNGIAGLRYVNKPKNHFSFTVNPKIVHQASFSDQAQAVVAAKLLTELKNDAGKYKRENIILYPASGNEKNAPWVMKAMQKNAQAMGVTISPQEVQIDKTHKVPGIVLTFS